ncbi:MAG: carboxypeptidase regulatory-like domain-containing protein [Deltaproteobacteria bacterium]|nr:carboxypeptidase regulatory-like domain-containing protein [Deltaproteobacteria bacterium]
MAMECGRRRWIWATLACAAMLLVPALLWSLVAGIGHGGRRPVEAPHQAPASAGSGVASGSGGAGDEDTSRIATTRVLVGRVVDQEGEPVADARLELAGYRGAGALSLDDGSYRLSMGTGAATELTVSARGFLTKRLSVPWPADGGRQRLDVTLQRAEDIGGVVLDPDGTPAPGARVRCASDDEPERSTRTDDDGLFSFGPEAAGCQAVADTEGYGRSMAVRLRPGPQNVLRLEEGASISGMLVDPYGAPVPSGEVAVESFRPAAGADQSPRGLPRSTLHRLHPSPVLGPSGDFELEKLSAGRYVLAASAPRRPPVLSEPIELEDGEQVRGTRLVLAAGATLSGRVLGAATGQPIADATVGLDLYTFAVVGAIEPAHSGADGRYRLVGVPPGPFSIRTSAPGFVQRIVAGLRTNGRDTLEQDVELEPVGDGATGSTEYEGIGAVLAERSGGVVIDKLIDGGAAQPAGVRAGDVIVRIDGQLAEAFTISQCVQHLRGADGARVVITLRRPGVGELDVLVRRSRIVVP